MRKHRFFKFGRPRSNSAGRGSSFLTVPVGEDHVDSSGSALRPTLTDDPNDYRLERGASELGELKKDSDLKKADVVIVVMGPTGAGKSRLIREATGEDVGVSDKLGSGALAIAAWEMQWLISTRHLQGGSVPFPLS